MTTIPLGPVPTVPARPHTTPTTLHHLLRTIIVSDASCYAWSGGEERENAEANTKGGRGKQRNVWVMIRGNGLVLLVHGRGWCYEKEVSETQHAHIISWEICLRLQK